MAVIQISKIQVRRGQKNSNSGIPQLSSAEFAWAVDSQELFIGNGSIAEGAPYVGNTKVLTEHDNLLELASSYQFAGNDVSVNNSQPRSLQSKLDEYVSVIDFGAVPDGSTDCVAAFERAFADLFNNADATYKKVLLVPNGVYLFSGNLRVPSTAIIQGETQNQTILDFGVNNMVFVNSDGLDYGTYSSGDEPTKININNLTISRTSGQVVLSGVIDSKFNHVKFLGEYELGQSVDAVVSRTASVSWENQSNGVVVNGIEFNNCEFTRTPLAVKCVQTGLFNTEIEFTNCKFTICETGVYVNGTPEQGTQWKLKDCKFEEIFSQAFLSTAGRGTEITRTSFKNCGNGLNSAATPITAIVEFGESQGNLLFECSSNRHRSAATNLGTDNTKYCIPEVLGSTKTTLVDNIFDNIGNFEAAQPLALFSTSNNFTQIAYTVTLNNQYTRQGTLNITVDKTVNTAAITDSYQYSSQTPDASGGDIITALFFNVLLKDNDADNENDTFVLQYQFPTLKAGQVGTISYSVSYGS
jgi:hypothetical protein